MSKVRKNKPHETEAISADTLEFTSRLIERSLMNLGMEVAVVAAYPGPVVSRYEIKPAVGVKVSLIEKSIPELTRELSVASIRLAYPLPGKTNMALELPNPNQRH